MEVLKVGEMFAGRYRVIRRLAEGGMGAVYVAVQEATELEVALKVLWPHVLQRSEAVGRFALEAKISARIRSDHIVQVFDAGFDQDTQMPFLVMELLQGLPLQGLVEQRGALAPADAIEIITQTARGLDRAHAYRDASGPAPVIHRDLKPDNIFVTRRETGEYLVKILDYGIAKILSQSTSLSREIKGTPIYMAYEQAVGQGLSPQTDVWALGLIAYFALTGQNYWRSTRSEESSLNTLLTEIVALPLDSASQRLTEVAPGASLPPAFDDWFQRCVNRDPKARFVSAGDAARELATVFGRSLSKSAPVLAFDATMLPQNARGSGGVSQSGNPVTGSPVTGALSGTAGGAATPAPLTQSVHIQRSRTPVVLGVAAVAVIGVVVALLGGQTAQEASNGSVAAAPVAPPTPEATEPKAVRATLQIEPSDAIAKVNGDARSVSNGTLQLEGAKGSVFDVELRVGEKSQTTAVRLIDTGTLDPAKIVLTVPPPAPAQSASAATTTAKPAVRVVAPTKKQVKPPPPEPKTAEPAPPPPPKKKVPFDPLSGPRVH
ncbi:MAG TPA: serine/threonine-protein kinase [Polyangiaceae bacterium]|nr:serine/threonine-protein kinase [Polyangiaceae bacterium]